jgi:hypothetical protein
MRQVIDLRNEQVGWVEEAQGRWPAVIHWACGYRERYRARRWMREVRE